MSKLQALRDATTKRELADLLGVKTTTLTHVLYVLKPVTQYYSFSIPKKSGGDRRIDAPSSRLKLLQARLSFLLQDCMDEIEKDRKGNGCSRSTLSHGFARERSIITNAVMHLGKKNVLNIDLKDFFDSFNFGRVRGFFIANKYFSLDPHIATVIAQIACYKNSLPQGSPCSPVITNLITHSLDIRLASLAKANSCIYTRYADDITISTREKVFPSQIMAESNGAYVEGKKLKSEISRAGFSLNNAKTRIQYKDSRQEVTGLVVNKKPGIKKEYWKKARAQCHSLFMTGAFEQELSGVVVSGNVNELEGRLNFIDQIDRYNRMRQKPALNPEYARATNGIHTNKLLSGREICFGRFLYYRLFYGNVMPTILCEGKTDNVYLKSAISVLVSGYPSLASPKSNDSPYELLVRFVKYTKRTRFLLQLYGGTSYLENFISAFDKRFEFYKAPRPLSPVIIVLDNDSGFTGINNKLKKISSAKSYPAQLKGDDFRGAEFVHVIHNLYIVLTPISEGNQTAIEDLFDQAARQIQVSGKSFNPKNESDSTTEYGKEIFAKKVVQARKDSIDFDGFKPLLDRIVGAIEHYRSLA